MPRDLTPAEMRALKTYCEKESHLAAAKALDISTQTLKNHLGAAYRKLDRKKSHSALYALCLQQGFDPFDTANNGHSSSTEGDPAQVISESPISESETDGKYPESPAGDPILRQTVGNDIIPNELSSLVDEDSVPDTADLPPILERAPGLPSIVERDLA